jgi:hypothetical protein
MSIIDKAERRAEHKEFLAVAKQERVYLDLLTGQNLFLEKLSDIVQNTAWNVKPYRSTKKSPFKRAVNVLLSDLHYGADLVPEEHPLLYGVREERRRTSAVVKEVLEYKEQYRKDTELVVHLAGDIIQGRLHDLRDGAPMGEQFARALWVLSGAVARFSEGYGKVTVYCTPGNHGRIKDRHHSRAVDQKWDSFEYMIFMALKFRFANLSNVKFVIPRTPYYIYDLFNLKGFITHGDTVLNPGYPGKAINVGRVETQVLKLISAFGHFDLVGTGHVHVASATQLPNGTHLVTNGCLIPPDSYAGSIGIHTTACGQQMWETVPGYMFGDHRVININEKNDKDSSLDAIIPIMEE